MRPMLLALVLSLAPLALMPSAQAAPACAVGADQPAYVAFSGLGTEVWQETNGVAGLQREPCEGDDGRVVPADTLVARGPGQPPPLPCLPVVRICIL